MRIAIAGMLAGVLFFGQFATPALAAESPTIVDTVLDDGLRVIIVPNHLAPVVTEAITYNVGSNDDGLEGIAHATEHMLFRGTKTVSSDQFANIATRIGAQYNAETQNMVTRYYFTVPSSYLDVVLHLEADRMTNANISQADWQSERGAIEQEVKAHLSNPVLPVFVRAGKIFLGDSPWARDGVGTIASFDKMTANDIASFYRTWYHPNNATLVIAGDVDPEHALASVKAAFGSIASVAVPTHVPLNLQPAVQATIKETIDFPIPIALVLFRTPGFDSPDTAATSVLFEILKSKRGPIADLVLNGKAIYAFAYNGTYPNVGTGMLATLLRPGSDPTASLSDIQAVLAAYSKDGVPKDLFDAAKARLLVGQAYDAASIPGQALNWSTAVPIEHKTPDQLYAAMANVTIDDVNRVLRASAPVSSQMTVALTARPGASMPKAGAGIGKEDVSVHAKQSVALPDWTAKYFSAPLHAPSTDAQSRTFHLKNGLTITYRREALSPTVVIEGRIDTNTDLNEPRGKDGVASLAASMLNRGTASLDYKGFQTALDSIAATVNLGSSFSASSRSEDFDRTVQLLADGELHPAFPSNQFDLIARNTISATRALEAQPQAKAAIARVYALYPARDPHRRHATSESLSRVTLDDVKRWHAFAYRPDLTTISVVGDVSADQVLATFDKYFGSWKVTGKRPNFTYPEIAGQGKRRPSRSTTVTSTTTQQADVTLTQRVPLRRGEQDVIALQLANTMLSGEGTGSMLFNDVRKDKGYVYSIDSDLSVSQTGSTFQLTFASDPKNVDAAQRTAARTLERLRRFPPSDSDLALAKAMTLSNFIVSVDSYDGLATELLASAEDGVDANGLSRYYSQVLATSPKDVQRAMQRWIDPSKFTRVIVAPQNP